MKIDTSIGEMNITSVVIDRVDCSGVYDGYDYFISCENGNREYIIRKEVGKSNKKKVEQIKKQIDFTLNLELTSEVLLKVKLEYFDYKIKCLENVTNELSKILSKFERAFNED